MDAKSKDCHFVQFHPMLAEHLVPPGSQTKRRGCGVRLGVDVTERTIFIDEIEWVQLDSRHE